jgi:hypothetical protein
MRGMDVYIRPMFSLIPDSSPGRTLTSAAQFVALGMVCWTCQVSWSAAFGGSNCWVCGRFGTRP